jgi:glutathione S-transferase
MTGIDGCSERLHRVLDDLDSRASDDDFWLGPRPTAADIGLFAHLHSLRLPLTPWLADQIARRARLSRYLDRVDVATRA